MKNLYKLFFMVLAVVTTACTENPLEDLEGREWQKERNVVSILVEGQIGTALIERDFDDAKINIYAKLENIEDISNVEIKDIQFSYGATSSNDIGTTLDFTSGTSTITVVSGSNDSLDWEVELFPFKSDLEGTWYIGEIGMYCDMFTWESWGWEKYEKITNYLPELNPELDNELIFTVEGADAKGNPFGSYEHNAGGDGVFGSFTEASKDWDFNDRFRKIPEGNGSWLRDFERNKVIITDQYNIEHELDLELFDDKTDVTLKAEVPYLANLFDWSNTDWSYEELAHMSKVMWYTLTKERTLQTGNAITSLSVVDQVGGAEIDGDNKQVTVLIEANGADLSMIEITDLGVSYKATANKQVGDFLDFSNDYTTEIVVTSETGEAETWTIKLKIDLDVSDVLIAGTWNINEMKMYSDLFTWESWGWDKTEQINNYLPNAGAELDNTITFNVDGKNAEGQAYGTYVHDAGADGEFANFVSDDASWPETDFNTRLRKIPAGSGTWILVEDVVTITDGNGVEHTLNLEVNTETEIALTSPLEYFAELFDWDVQNYSYEEVAHMSNKMWYTLSKQ